MGAAQASIWLYPCLVVLLIICSSRIVQLSKKNRHLDDMLFEFLASIMRYVIIPNSLPEIFTGARVAMGVCWGTVVAAELVAAEKGAGMMIMVASKFQSTDIVLMGIILIGIIGFSIDMLMRWAEKILVPWKGKS